MPTRATSATVAAIAPTARGAHHAVVTAAESDPANPVCDAERSDWDQQQGRPVHLTARDRECVQRL